MNKRILVIAFACVFAFSSLVGCGNNQDESSKGETEVASDTDKTETEEVATDDNSNNDIEVESEELPAYEYPGPELFYSVLYDYIIDDVGQYFDNSGVMIPSVSIIYLDENNKEDILVYGDFWIYTYKLNGQTLECEAGGDFPGLIHVASSDEGYQVTGFDKVEDGSNFDSSAKSIFGDYYDEFIALSSDTEAKEAVRAQIIANYVFANDLNITQYQDSGWDPVELPEQNIDSFYSDL